MKIIRRIAVVVMPLFALLTMGVMRAPRPSPTGFQAVRVWANAHRDMLPNSVDAFAAFAAADRKAIYSEMTDAQRELLWREHLESFVADTATLTPTQRRIRASVGSRVLTAVQRSAILASIDSLKRMFGPGLSVEERKAIAKRLCAMTSDVFNKDDAKAVAGQLVPPDDSSMSLASVGSRSVVLAGFGGSLGGMFRAIATKIGLLRQPVQSDIYCSCSSYSLCDCSNCFQTYPSCTRWGHFCGCYMLWDCNGCCSADPKRCIQPQ